MPNPDCAKKALPKDPKSWLPDIPGMIGGSAVTFVLVVVVAYYILRRK